MKRILVLGALAAVACGLSDNDVVGKWENGSGQLMVVRSDLTGFLTQSATCTPTIEIAMERDPFGAWAVRINPNQRVFFPPDQVKNFQAKSFCSSPGTKPMCDFCRVEGTRMDCDSPEQEIVGAGSRVTHNCHWLNVLTTSTATVAPASCGPFARVASCTAEE